MTVEGILRRRGSEMDLYSPRYFESASIDHSSVDQFIEMVRGGGVILYGQEMINKSPTAVAINGDYLIPYLSQLSITYANREFTIDKIRFSGDESDWNTDEAWRLDDPPIPPEVGYISSNLKVDMQKIRSRYIAPLDSTAPRYYSIDRSTEDIEFVKDDNNPDDLLIKFNTPGFRPQSCIFFVNGLCCRSEQELFNNQYVTRVTDGRRYLRNLRDRNRGIIMLDFSEQCGMLSYPLKYVSGNFPRFTIDTTIDVTDRSFLLVINGRLYTPDEFSVLSNNYLFTLKSYYRPEYTLDQLCCANEFTDTFLTNDGTKIARNRALVADDSINLKNAKNSFLIILNRKGLMVLRHDSRDSASQEIIEHKIDPMKQDRAIFQGIANGLVFDTATRSVVDSVREENDMSFYDHTGTKPRIWRETSVYMNHSTPLELTPKYNNVMKTCAVMHDRSNVQGNSFVLWPKYVMLDFLFKGS